MSEVVKKNGLQLLTSFYKNLPTEVVIEKEQQVMIVVDKVTTSKITLKEGAKLTFVLCAQEGWDGITKLTFVLDGREAELTFLGFVIGTGKNNFSFETISLHQVPQTKAHYFLRAAMFDHSVVDYKGNLIITKPAQLTDTYLSHHTLLLSDHARARTVPALEIEADDVKAGHAATIGKVDKELMFYLMSRGMNEKEVEQLLIAGFFETQLRMIPEEHAQILVREAIMAALPEELTIESQ